LPYFLTLAYKVPVTQVHKYHGYLEHDIKYYGWRSRKNTDITEGFSKINYVPHFDHIMYIQCSISLPLLICHPRHEKLNFQIRRAPKTKIIKQLKKEPRPYRVQRSKSRQTAKGMIPQFWIPRTGPVRYYYNLLSY